MPTSRVVNSDSDALPLLYSGATFTVGVAIAPLLLAESSGDGSAATFLATFFSCF